MRGLILVVGCALWLGACGFEETTPENVSFEMTGPEGAQVFVVFSTNFVAGVTEAGVTEVGLNLSDTLVHRLPIDTVISVAVDQRFFAEVLPIGADSLDVGVRIYVDDRRLLEESGRVYKEPPFRYVYLYNQRFTSVVDVVF